MNDSKPLTLTRRGKIGLEIGQGAGAIIVVIGIALILGSPGPDIPPPGLHHSVLSQLLTGIAVVVTGGLVYWLCRQELDKHSPAKYRHTGH